MIKKNQISRILAAKQEIYLAYGYSDVMSDVWVKNFTETQLGIYYPKFGNWKSEYEIKGALSKKIEEKFPAKAFPFLKPGKITLYSRNEEDISYLHNMGDLDSEGNDA